mmetsp:Transcript_127499/g.302967  ORF Transcript_127499/g.302967 Transcript_127499/m.302967 type:complete len:249 (+) Transcript_127499:1913-2659(+)
MYSCSSGPCLAACTRSFCSFSMYALRSKPRRPRCWAISVTLLVSSLEVYSSGSSFPLRSRPVAVPRPSSPFSFFLSRFSFSFALFSASLAFAHSAFLSRSASFSGVMSHRSIFLSRTKSSSPSPSDVSDFPELSKLSESESELALPVSEESSESLSESELEESELEELEEESEELLRSPLSLASLAESLASGSSSDWKSSGLFLSCSKSSAKGLLPFFTLARRVLNALFLLSWSLIPFCFFSSCCFST